MPVKKPTIRDVAKASGVSIATVSHVLNNRNQKVGADTRDRVLAAIRELRYRPTPKEENQLAIRTMNIGFVVGDAMLPLSNKDDYFMTALQEVIEVAAAKGYSVTIVVERVWDAVGSAARRRFDGRCDGVVLLAPILTGETIQALWERGTPLVTVGTRLRMPGVSCVDVDNFRVGEIAAHELIKAGHKRIAFFSSEGRQASTYQRYDGFRSVFIREGLPLDGIVGCCADWPLPKDIVKKTHAPAVSAMAPLFRYCGREPGLHTAEEFLDFIGRDKTAVFFWNDSDARKYITMLQAAGVRIPEDLSVISVDNWPSWVIGTPNLTSIGQDLREVARTSAKLLIEKIEDHTQADKNIVVAPHLVERDSITHPREAPLLCS